MTRGIPLAFLLFSAHALVGCDGKPAAGGAPPPSVVAARPLQKTITEWDEYTGRFEAVETVEVRARVSGFIDSVHYKEGQIVKQGDLLFIIDPRPYRIAVEQAKADVERAKAKLEIAALDVQRATPLVRSQTLTEREFDTRRANERDAAAQVASLEAASRQAELNLAWTEVRAPIGGRISSRRVDPGNLIAGGQSGATLLTVIVSIDPIHFVFDGSETDFLRYLRLAAAGERPSSRDVQNPVSVRLADESDYKHQGRMDFVDNVVSPKTGTIRGRAVFDNKDGLLTPGFFGRLRLFGGEHEALLVPDGAIASDQSSKIVFTVADDGMVASKRVELGPIVDGLRVVRSGLAPTDRIVIEGLQRARPGQKVTAEDGKIEDRRPMSGRRRSGIAGGSEQAPTSMRFAHFFIDRPIFAAVLSILVTLVGAISFRALPITEYPEIAPPTVEVRATYAGAAAEVIAETVAAPIEQEINGVDNMLYVVSQSTGNGALSIQVVFKPGTNIDQAQVLVQNRVAIALPRLPVEVQRIGVTVRKRSPDLMMVIHLVSPDGTLDQQYISNYATINIKDVLTRVDGVGDTIVFGARDYAMRVWLDPAKVQARGLTASDVVGSLRAANVSVAAGAINQPPATSPGGFEVAVQTLGRLSSPDQFSDIVVATDADGRVTRVRDIARVELGADDYRTNAYLDNQVATAIGIFQRPGSNALATAASVLATMEELAKSFPQGLAYRVAYNTTEFIEQSVDEVITTLFEAAVLVVIVIILFLQSWRAAIIPIIAIPVSLIGTFFVMKAFGFSLNNLTLFGLVLAIGIVVDDAIVVVENVERYLREGMSPRDAAHKTMDEVGGALVAIALVLCAVFIPTAFITGISGEFYRQFAITIAASTIISAMVSLTLSPALAALLLRPHGHDPRSGWRRTLSLPFDRFFAGFNRGFARLSSGYAGLTRRVLRVSAIMLVIYGGLIGLTYFQFARTPSGFIPPLDRAYFITAISLPPGASLERTDRVVRRASEMLLSRPGVAHAVTFAGFDGATFTNAPNYGRHLRHPEAVQGAGEGRIGD